MQGALLVQQIAVQKNAPAEASRGYVMIDRGRKKGGLHGNLTGVGVPGAGAIFEQQFNEGQLIIRDFIG